MNKKSMVAVLLAICMVGFAGCANVPDTTYCERCGEEVLQKYIFDEADLYLCPNCAYEVLELALDPNYRKCVHCCSFFDKKWSHTGELCEDCEDVYAKPCAICDQMRRCWELELDFVLCESCLSGVFRHQEAQDYVLNDE